MGGNTRVGGGRSNGGDLLDDGGENGIRTWVQTEHYPVGQSLLTLILLLASATTVLDIGFGRALDRVGSGSRALGQFGPKVT